MPDGNDDGRGREPVVTRLIGEKDPALEEARAAGLTVLEGRYSVRKYRGDSVDPADLYEVLETAPNLFLTAGINTVLKLAAGQAGTAYNATNTRLAVGDGTTVPAAADTDLKGTNKFRQVVDSAPVVSTNQVTFVATFGTGVANYDWQEVGVVNGSGTSGEMWSRTVQNLGTKTSAATWILDWTLSIS